MPWGGVVVMAMLLLVRPAAGEWSQLPAPGVSVAAAESSWVSRASRAAAGGALAAKSGAANNVVAKNEAGKRAATRMKRTVPAAGLPASNPLGIDSIASQLNGTQSVPWSIVLGLTLLTLLPALLLSMTPMVRLLVVFHFLRQALGTQTAPSNQVLMGLGLMMTWFLMQPVMLQVDQQALAPYRAGTISGEQALELGAAPVKAYMLHYAREKDLGLFASAGMTARPASKQDLPMQVVVPAYMLSELKAGFQIGAVLFLPFLLVDMAIASITTSVGMMQLPPVVISTPVKILLFVMVDGWNLLAGSLLKSF
jgi:flagellar biosynthetic protein FliP